ncbi:protein-disulfide reductase DsbD family protein [Novosphingobium bradum]|uniref:Protein-disulfide reductase DsbD family protein n=1 Tax=Novosphingobium bradum TaxID=1737444 RepID=A0ABV7ITU4_9SPHN
MPGREDPRKPMFRAKPGPPFMPLRYRRSIAVLLQALVVLLAAFAAPASAAPTHIAARLLAEGPVQAGGTATLAIAMRPEPGWHGYWSNPGDAGFGMTLDWALPAGAQAAPPRYPVPRTLVVAGLMNHVFEQAYGVLVDLRLPAGLAPGTRLPVRVKAEWLACTDQVCVPERAELATTLTIGPAGRPDPQFDAWRAKLPAPLGAPARFQVAGDSLRLGLPLPRGLALDAPHVFPDQDGAIAYAAPQDFRRQGDLLVITLKRSSPNAPAALSGVLRLDGSGNGLAFAATPGMVPAGGEPLAAGGTAARLALLVLAALAGGLLLNVMPCVFPILSLKALSLARAGESPAQARAEGLAYTAGVVLACAALGALLLALRAAGHEIGWAFQLQEPGVVAALLVLVAAIAANLAGLFEFAVPGFARGGSTQGAFATGLLAAFVATPCTGPFMATAMGAALLLPAAQAMALFVALGLGLALPFVAIAFVPALRRALPRPGRWMTRLRHGLALPMALTALALAWLAWRLGGALFAGLALGLTLALLALLGAIGQAQRRGRSARGLALGGALAVLAALAALPLAAAPERPASLGGILASRPFSEAELARARASGKPVFAWFTADWCLTCKVNEEVAIERAATAQAFARAGVVVLRGDWTRRDPAIARYLASQGAAGVPLYVWYPAHGGAPRVLPQLLNPDTLPDLAR